MRIVLAAVAVLACAWFGLGALQARDTTRATEIVESANFLHGAQAAQVSSLLSTASTLNPDTTIELLRAQAQGLEGRSARSMETALSAARDEPDNVEAWLTVAQLALSAKDRAILSQAVRQLARLDPRLH